MWLLTSFVVMACLVARVMVAYYTLIPLTDEDRFVLCSRDSLNTRWLYTKQIFGCSILVGLVMSKDVLSSGLVSMSLGFSDLLL